MNPATLTDFIRIPKNWVETFDIIHEEHGFFDTKPDEQWWQTRTRWAGMLRKTAASKGVTERQLAIASWYTSIGPGEAMKTPWGLFTIVPEAMAAYNTQMRNEAAARMAAAREKAVGEALAHGWTEWSDRLLRVSEAGLPEALREWRDKLHEPLY